MTAQYSASDGRPVELRDGGELRDDEHGTRVVDPAQPQVVGELDACEDHAAVVVEIRLLVDEVEFALQLVVVALLLDVAKLAEQADNLSALIDRIL